MGILEAKDAELGTSIIHELRDDFKKDMLEFDEFVLPKLPRSMTPADLPVIYEAQSYLSGWLWFLSHKVSKWHRLSNEVLALADKRKKDDESARFKYIVENADVAGIKELKSEAQKLTVAGDKLDLDGTGGIAYLAALVKGWHAQVLALYSRLEKQSDLLLTHLSILRSEIGVRPPGPAPQS